MIPHRTAISRLRLIIGWGKDSCRTRAAASRLCGLCMLESKHCDEGFPSLKPKQQQFSYQVTRVCCLRLSLLWGSESECMARMRKPAEGRLCPAVELLRSSPLHGAIRSKIRPRGSTAEPVWGFHRPAPGCIQGIRRKLGTIAWWARCFQNTTGDRIPAPPSERGLRREDRQARRALPPRTPRKCL